MSRSPERRYHRRRGASALHRGRSGCGRARGAAPGRVRTRPSSGSTTPTAVTSTAPPSTTATTAPPIGEVAVAFPVVACTGAPGRVHAGHPRSSWLRSASWRPSHLLHRRPIPTALGAAQVAPSSPRTGAPHRRHSDPDHAPAGPCSGQVAAMAPGATELVVYPPDDPEPAHRRAPAGRHGGDLRHLRHDRPHVGGDLVCDLFTIPAWQAQSAGVPDDQAGRRADLTPSPRTSPRSPTRPGWSGAWPAPVVSSR